MVYMLVGYDKHETWERVMYRFQKMVARGIRPYPMIFGERNRGLPLGGCNHRIGHRTLSEFQRWAIRKAYTFIPFEHYDVNAKGRADKRQTDLFAEAPTNMRTQGTTKSGRALWVGCAMMALAPHSQPRGPAATRRRPPP